jgi:hypothetical protein
VARQPCPLGTQPCFKRGHQWRFLILIDAALSA